MSIWGSKNRDQERIIQISPGAERSLALCFIRLTRLLQTLGPIATRHVSTQFNPATLKKIDFGVSLEVVPCPGWDATTQWHEWREPPPPTLVRRCVLIWPDPHPAGWHFKQQEDGHHTPFSISYGMRDACAPFQCARLSWMFLCRERWAINMRIR